MSDSQSFPMSVSCRQPLVGGGRIVAAIAVGLLIGMLPTPTIAGPPPTGTISCSVAAAGSTTKPTGFFFSPYMNADPRNLRVRAKNLTSTCDASGVVGGKAPIVGVELKFSARMINGSCASFISAPEFQKGQVKLRWLGLNPSGRPMTVGVSSVKLASASYDSGSKAVILITQPIAKGAFAGATASLHLGLDYPEVFESQCDVGGVGGYVAMPFGELNPSTVDVQ